MAALGAGAALDDPQVIDPAAFFPEGPVMVGDQLIYAQYAGNVVSVWDGQTITTLWQRDGCGPSAVVPVAAGYLITCYDNGTLAVIGADGSDIAMIAVDTGGQPLIGPNDGTPDGQGGAWVTLSGPWESGPIVGRILHVDAAGGRARWPMTCTMPMASRGVPMAACMSTNPRPGG